MTTATPIAIGALMMSSSKLLDRYAVTIAELSKPEITSELESQFQALISAEHLTTPRDNLSSAYTAFQTKYKDAQALARNTAAESRYAISLEQQKRDENIAAIESNTAGDIAATEKQIADLKQHLSELQKQKAKRIAEAQNSCRETVTGIKAEVKTKASTYLANCRELSTALAESYRAADEAYRAAEGIWTANCNEKSKRSLIRQVFPRLTRSTSKKSTTVKTDVTTSSEQKSLFTTPTPVDTAATVAS